MNSQHTHFHQGGSTGANSAPFPVSALSTYNLLRNYNYLLSPHNADFYAKFQTARLSSGYPLTSTQSFEDIPTLQNDKPFKSSALSKSVISTTPIFGIHHAVSNVFESETQALLDPLNNNSCTPTCNPYSNPSTRRQRGEKKRIPEEQKDDKYFERRKRNNQAAKKSRDARKFREDQIAFRATLLDHENALLKAQVLTLQEEAASLRHMLFQKKAFDLSNTNSSVCQT